MNNLLSISPYIENIFSLTRPTYYICPCSKAAITIQQEIIPRIALIALAALELLQQMKPDIDHLLTAGEKQIQNRVINHVETLAKNIFAHLQTAGHQTTEFFSHWKKAIEKECFDAVSSTISICILPSLIKYSALDIELKKREAAAQIEEMNKQNAGFVQTIEFEGREGVSLTHDLDINPNKKTILYLLGNGALWQTRLPALSDLHRHTEANVICYNYRGTGGNLQFPTTEAAPVSDGILLVKDLLTQGITADKILLYGHSLGGAIAISIASHLAQEDIILDLCINRSFRSLYAVIKKVMPFFAEECANLVTNFGWRLNSEEALPKLKGNLIVIENKHDPLIVPETSFKSALEAASSLSLRKISIIEMDDQEFESENQARLIGKKCNPHTRPLSKREKNELHTAITNLWV